MAGKYTVSSKEFGRGRASVKRFSDLRDVQAYIKDQWQGVEYMDGSQAFHTDYCTFSLSGCTLKDLGERQGAPGTDEYWQWEWREFDPAKLAEITAHRCKVTATRFNSETDTLTVQAVCRVDGCGYDFRFCMSGDDDWSHLEMADCGRHRAIEDTPVTVADDSTEIPF